MREIGALNAVSIRLVIGTFIPPVIVVAGLSQGRRRFGQRQSPVCIIDQLIVAVVRSRRPRGWKMNRGGWPNFHAAHSVVGIAIHQQG